MSYRHSSYRKVRRALEHARRDPLPAPSRTDGNRVSHWLNARPMGKPETWGRPKGAWERLPADLRSAPRL